MFYCNPKLHHAAPDRQKCILYHNGDSIYIIPLIYSNFGLFLKMCNRPAQTFQVLSIQVNALCCCYLFGIVSFPPETLELRVWVAHEDVSDMVPYPTYFH